MKNNTNIKSSAWLLLLIYIFSINPAILFHHHNENRVAYEKATSCEKAIFYGDKSGKCTHKNHISKASEKCSLCDNHNLSAHIVELPFFNFVTLECKMVYDLDVINLITYFSNQTFNKGPPVV